MLRPIHGSRIRCEDGIHTNLKRLQDSSNFPLTGGNGGGSDATGRGSQACTYLLFPVSSFSPFPSSTGRLRPIRKTHPRTRQFQAARVELPAAKPAHEEPRLLSLLTHWAGRALHRTRTRVVEGSLSGPDGQRSFTKSMPPGPTQAQ